MCEDVEGKKRRLSGTGFFTATHITYRSSEAPSPWRVCPARNSEVFLVRGVAAEKQKQGRVWKSGQCEEQGGRH
ncbi:hypothetical protein AAFF_G00186020 [Aldrovandia affinis]|uniref:Uncharacterized protein n=1 Tax=Aldrovandia affinis TaxID=143900 RepID=A0AAD7SXP1_9TELE|nr:hypothetical protein AAFF_G00186020 [Aldrovandia affinis]